MSALHERIAPRFARPEVRARAGKFLAGLLDPVERRNGWQLAEEAGKKNPVGMQHLLAPRADWDADAVRDDRRAYVVEHLGDPEGVLVVDERGFSRRAEVGRGPARIQGHRGPDRDCQMGSSSPTPAPAGTPSSTANSTCRSRLPIPRRQEAGVPEEVTFRTKPQLAPPMLARAFAAGVPAGWVTGDAVYGGDRRLRVGSERKKRMPHVLAIKSDRTVVARRRPGPSSPAERGSCGSDLPVHWCLLTREVR